MIALALVAGIIVSQIVLLATAGSIGIPGVFSVQLDGETPRTVASDDAKPKRKVRKDPPPIAMPAPSDEPGSQNAPDSQEADAQDTNDVAAPVAQPAGEPDSPEPDAAAETGEPSAADSEREPSNGPVGWKGPEGGPGKAADDADEAVLNGSIDLDVGDALSDLNREEAEEKDEEKNDGGSANGPASSAQPAPPPAAGASGEREVLPWEAVKPDPELMAPVDVPEDTPEFSLPAPDVVKGWLQGRASNAASGQTRYELWLEPSMDMRLRLTAVGYQFKPKSGDMITRLSRKPESGFRVSFESSGCDGTIILILTYKDGRSHKVPVDGCGTFN